MCQTVFAIYKQLLSLQGILRSNISENLHPKLLPCWGSAVFVFSVQSSCRVLPLSSQSGPLCSLVIVHVILASSLSHLLPHF